MHKSIMELNEELGVMLGESRLRNLPVKDLNEKPCEYCDSDMDTASSLHSKQCLHYQEFQADSQD